MFSIFTGLITKTGNRKVASPESQNACLLWLEINSGIFICVLNSNHWEAVSYDMRCSSMTQDQLLFYPVPFHAWFFFSVKVRSLCFLYQTIFCIAGRWENGYDMIILLWNWNQYVRVCKSACPKSKQDREPLDFQELRSKYCCIHSRGGHHLHLRVFISKNGKQNQW